MGYGKEYGLEARATGTHQFHDDEQNALTCTITSDAGHGQAPLMSACGLRTSQNAERLPVGRRSESRICNKDGEGSGEANPAVGRSVVARYGVSVLDSALPLPRFYGMSQSHYNRAR